MRPFSFRSLVPVSYSARLSSAIGLVLLITGTVLFVMSRPSPEKVDPGWVQLNGPLGGMINTVEIDPDDSKTLYAGGEGGWVYKSTDGGENWINMEKIVDPPQAIMDIIVAKQGSTKRLYALSFNIFRRDALNGTTWEIVENSKRFNCIAMNPRNNSELLAARSEPSELWFSLDGGDTWIEITGDLASSGIAPDAIAGIWDVAFGQGDRIWAGISNKGVDNWNGHLFYTDYVRDRIGEKVTWTKVSFGQETEDGQPPCSDIRSILVVPDKMDEVYVGLFNVENKDFNNSDWYLVRTVDNGGRWDRLVLPPFLESRQSPTWTGQIYIMGWSGGTLYVGNGGEFFSTGDGGENWTEITPPDRSDDPWDIAIDSTTKGRVLYLPRRAQGISKNENFGDRTSWRYINNGLKNGTLSLLARSGGATLYASSVNGAGTFISKDNGDSWTRITEGIDHPWADELTVLPQSGAGPNAEDHLWQVADAAKVYETTTSGRTWSRIIDAGGWSGFKFGSVYALATAPSNPDVIYALKNGFGIFKSSTRGIAEWEFLNNSDVDYTYSIAVHPQTPDIVFSGYNRKPFETGAKIQMTIDGGYEWQTAKTVPEAPGADGFTSVAFDPRSSAESYRVYAGSTGEKGRVWLYESDSGEFVEPNEQFSFTNIHTMAVDPGDPLVAYAGVWGGGTFRTIDGGATWKRLPNDPTVSASAILIDPANPQRIFLADRTAPRIYRMAADLRTWEVYYDAGKSYYRVMSAAIAPRSGTTPIIYASIFSFGGPMSGDLFRIEDQNRASLCTGVLPRLPVALTVDTRQIDGLSLYAVLHGYGVYKTTSGGVSWEEISGPGSRLPQNVGFNGLMIHPSDPMKLYLYGGCDVNLELAHSGAHPADIDTVYFSSDGGSTWNNLEYQTLNSGTGSVKGMAIGLDNTLYVGTLKGVWRFSERTWRWDDMNNGLPYRHTAGVALSRNGQTIYAPTLGAGIYTGTILDGGRGGIQWQARSGLTVPIYNVQVAAHPSTDGVVYASGYPGGLFKSLDRGVTWSECNFGMASFKVEDPNRQGYYAFSISPSMPDVLYLGLYGVGIYKSIDGAATWQPVNGVDNIMARQTITSLLVDRSNFNVVYVGTEYGVFRTIDGGINWATYNPSALNPDIVHISPPPVIPQFAPTALPSPLGPPRKGKKESPDTRRVRLSDSLVHNIPIQLPQTAVKLPTDFIPWMDVRTLSQGADGVIYAGTRGYELFANIGPYRSWQHLMPFGNFGTFWPMWKNRPLYQYTSLLFHPSDPHVIYAGTFPAGIYKSTDGGATWRERNVGWTNDGVFTLVFEPDDLRTIYAGTYNGVNVSRDEGEHWEISANGWPKEQWVFSIDFDPQNSETMFACSKDGRNKGTGPEQDDQPYFFGTVMKSVDGGKNWFQIIEGLDVDVVFQEFYKIIADKVRPGVLYLASQKSGVYISRNSGDTWQKWNDGLFNMYAGTNGNNVTNTMVCDADYRYIYFGTVGSGIFRRELGFLPKKPDTGK